MIRSRLGTVFLVLVLFANTNVGYAQEQVAEEEIITTVTTGGADESSPLQCFDFYKFNSVEVNLEASVESTVPGTQVTFFGTINNTNPYPLTDVTLVAKVFRVNEELVQQSNGNELVDYFTLEEEMVLNAGEIKDINYEWEVPTRAAGGSYFVAVYVLDSNFALTGLAFSDDVYTNPAYFNVAAEDVSAIFLDKNATTLNGEIYQFAQFPPIINASNTPVVVSTELVNPSDEVRSVPLQWKQYSFDGSREDNLRNVKTEVVTLEPGERKVVSYEVKEENDPVVFISAVTENNGVRSILHLRYIQEDKRDVTRFSFAGLSSFPLTTGTAVTALTCAHTTGEPLSENKITLTLTDNHTGDEIYRYVYEGQIDGQVGGYGEEFIPTTNYDNVTLKATLENEGVTVEEVETVYNCKNISGVTCFERKNPDVSLFEKIISNPLWLFSGVAILLALLFLVWSVHRRHRARSNINVMSQTPSKTPLSLLFVFILIPLLLLSGASSVEAKTKSVTGSVSGNGGGHKGVHLNFEADYTVVYRATFVNQATGREISSGATLPAGTVVELRPGTRANGGVKTSDVQYNFTGSVMGTPNGAWDRGYNPADRIGSGLGLGCGGFLDLYYNIYTAFNVDKVPETFSLSGVAFTELSPGVYRLDGNGSGVAKVHFPSTTGTWNSYAKAASATGQGCTGGLRAINTNIRATSIDFTFNVTGGNETPNPPSITGPSTCTVNVSSNFNFSGTDPDGDQVRYGVDWDMNGSVDQWVPGSGRVNSGTSRSAGHTWSTTGTKNFRALTQDSNGSNSGWSSTFSTTCSNPPATANLTINNSNGPITVADGAALNIAWSSTNAASCTLYGADLSGGGGTVAINDNTTATADNSDTYVLSCNGATDSVQVSVTEPPVNGVCGSTRNYCSAGTFSDTPDSATHYQWNCAGQYSGTTANCSLPKHPNLTPSAFSYSGNVQVDSTITLNGTVQNNGQRNTGAGFTDVFEYRIGNTGGFSQIGTEYNNTLAQGGTNSDSRTFTIPSAAAGNNIWVQYCIDHGNAIAESNESVSDNCRQLNLGAIANPPTANLQVKINSGGWSSSDQTINPDDTVTLRWSTTDASTCSGTNVNTGGAANSSSVSAATPNPGDTTTYSISCSGGGGSTNDSLSVTARQRPNFTQPIINVWPSVGYNPTTGIYDQVIVTFQTQNNGGSDTQAAATYSVEFDRENNGYDETETGVAGMFNVNESKNFTETFSSVPFGSISVRVTIDSTNAVTETNESDNVHTFDLIIPPPDPELSIEANRTLVRKGDTVTITWDATAAYPLNCTIIGPAGINVTDSTAPYNGSQNTDPITAKSEFTFRCVEPSTNTTFTEIEVVEVVGSPEEI